MRFFQAIIRYTLGNVVFGIALMVLVGLYVAIGSGLPLVREYFEMSDLEFFSAWPLKLLMLLLCLNLAVVTWTRIPLTPPRWGVWCIHAGIVTLIVGMSIYYRLKIEGRTLIAGGHTVESFYDTGERALYARNMDQPLFGMHAFPSLPRFQSYDIQRDPERLQRADLTGIDRFSLLGSTTNRELALSDWLGLKDKVSLDIVGFYPYADISQDAEDDPQSSDQGVELTIPSPHGDADAMHIRLTAADPTAARALYFNTELEHRQVSAGSLAAVQESAGWLFDLSIQLPNQPIVNLKAEPGQVYTIDGGYKITIDSYNPAFPMFGTHEVVPVLTLHVISTAPATPREFWRMILADRPLQTDFKMDPATTPPMVKGNRQKEPLDKNLAVQFKVNDPAAVLPSQGQEKHTFFTAGDHQLLDVHTSFNGPVEIKDMSGGGQVPLPFDTGTAVAQVRRLDHVRVISSVIETPSARRSTDEGESGAKQVLVVRVHCGNWSEDVAVPCDPYAGPDRPDGSTGEPTVPWQMGVVRIPGATSALQLQLGFLSRLLPAALTLRNLELIHYPGGTGDSGPYRDFRSTLEILDASGDSNVAVASLNNPIYFNGGNWIFFQSGYDPQGQWSIIGVGNRPGVWIMITGFVMVVAGLMYAFYAKPVVIARMKASALRRAAERPREAVVS